MTFFLDGKVRLLKGDCLELLPTLEEGSIDSCVTDPPYHLTSIVKRFGQPNSAPVKVDRFCNHAGADKGVSPYARSSKGFMGKQWDGGDIAFRPEVWAEVLRVLKPGAHLLAFSGTRTYHRMACAIEDAGFEIRDQIGWAYGSGFPKSHNIGNGWGSALKPAWEPIVLARKPLSESSIAANVLKHGTGGINVDGCRVEFANESDRWKPEHHRQGSMPHPMDWETNGDRFLSKKPQGRWPANLIHDGSEEVVSGFPIASKGTMGANHTGKHDNLEYGYGAYERGSGYGDEGSAARFFYTAKADSNDRLGSKHPTVKPVDLIQYLVRLITPSGGLCLDPFAGTGTTGEAAFRESMRCILIEREPEYQADIERRMALVLAGPEERIRESIKARGLVEEAGPLFGGTG
jgi:site-specific DNA-methyltransferase (adenine-specific)